MITTAKASRHDDHTYENLRYASASDDAQLLGATSWVATVMVEGAVGYCYLDSMNKGQRATVYSVWSGSPQ